MANNTMDTQSVNQSLPVPITQNKDDKISSTTAENEYFSQVNEKCVNSDSEISEKSASSDSRSTCVVNVRTEADIEPTCSRIRPECDDTINSPKMNGAQANVKSTPDMDRIQAEDPNKIETVSQQNSRVMQNNSTSSTPSNNSISTNASPRKNASTFGGENSRIGSPLKQNISEQLPNILISSSPVKREAIPVPASDEVQEDITNETDSLLQNQTQSPEVITSNGTFSTTGSEKSPTNGKLSGHLPRNSSIKSASELEQHYDVCNETDNLLQQQTNGKIPRFDNTKSTSELEQDNDSERLLQKGKNASVGNFPKKGITKSSSADIDKPVLHVQFDNKKSVSGSTIPVKDQCSSPTASISTSSDSTSSSSSSDDDDIGISEARPPDGGWGWVVVAASFVVNLIADGITFSFGVIYVEFLNYFGEGKSKTAWIGSLFMAMPLLSGPVASFLTDRYGCRKVSIVGSILASTGFVISTFANSMELLFFTFGILAGFGLSLCYVAAVVIVAYYFDKRRSFATGLSVCGSGIGTFIFAPLIQVLLAEYGWRGTTLILAGLFLNLAVCGALMRDLPWTSHKRKVEKKNRSRERKRRRNNSSAETFSVSNSTNTASAVQASGTSQTGENGSRDKNLEQQTDDRLFSSLVNLPTYVRNGEKVPVEVLELLSTNKNVYNVLMQNYPGLLTSSRSFSDSGRLHENQPPGKFVPTISPLAVEHPQSQPSQSSKPSNTDAAFFLWLKKTGNDQQPIPPRLHEKKHLPAYLRDLRVHRLSLTYRGAMLNINRYRLRASSCPDIYRNSMTTIAKEKNQWYAGLWEFRDVLVDMLDFSHFAEPRFLLFSLSNFLLYTWYDVPYVYLTDNALENGYSETDSSMLIAIVGIVNMIGEV